ncbi:PTS sugar transporter subunit IIA [Neobacillus sp.]|uniref:BglG family transcription antiterminator n=1 Tax=Neobacillus sp. TaxID=2675273 RepID=UPI00289C8C9E|nr:PTS sugar transporter subunit IIA [Neobacillus sp.]
MSKTDMLLDYLKKHSSKDFISAKTLADLLGVTDRTIRHYVKSINDEQPNLIESSRVGYRISDHTAKVVKHLENANHIDNRRFYILRRLIKSSDRGLDLFDLADTLYISDATIRADMNYLNRLVTKNGLQIIQQNNRYVLTGDEKSRRKVMIDLIDFSKPTKTSIDEEVQKLLGDVSLQELMKLSKNSFEKYSVHPNTYFFKNFIVHLAIAIDRVTDNEQLEQSSFLINNRNTTSFKIVNDITDKLNKIYNTQFSQADKDELAILFYGQIKDDEKSLDDYTNNKVSQALEHAIQEIGEVYLLDFNDDHFKTRLLIHVQNLYNRLMQNKYTRNLSVLNIRIKHPIIFDIAVYLASVLSNDLNVEINDDEIAFIALHIGSFLNSQQDENNKIKTVIITPAYLRQQTEIEQYIQKRFDDDLEIEGTFEDISDLNPLTSPELVITTQNAEHFGNGFATANAEIVCIHEFMTKRDTALIRRAVEKIKHNKYLNFLREKMPELVREKFFFNISDDSPKEQIMKTIADVFQQNGYVDEDYLKKLNEREKVSSTAFPSGVAIPHTMKFEAKKTGLMILKPVTQIDWDSIKIKLIIGIAVNKEDSQMFNMIFPRIIELIAEPYNINYLVGADTRHELIHRLIELMAKDNYFSE